MDGIYLENVVCFCFPEAWARSILFMSSEGNSMQLIIIFMFGTLVIICAEQSIFWFQFVVIIAIDLLQKSKQANNGL